MEEFSLSEEEKAILLATARESISARLRKTAGNFPAPTKNLRTRCGAFVTLHIHGSLRGCIGQMTGTMPLIDTIREMAVSSAFHDPRFPSLDEQELGQVDIEISVLTPLEKIEDISVIQVGRHGIFMKKGGRSGVLLPQVAVEQGWDRETFLTHTCYKAGFPGSCWKDASTEISIFSAIVFGEKQQP